MAEEFKVSFSSLIRGDLYPIKSIEKSVSKFHGKDVNGMKVCLLDEELEIVTYLPKALIAKFDEPKFNAINVAGETANKFSVCYYGKIDNQEVSKFFGEVHGPGEGRNEKLYNDVGKMMTKYGKRKAEEPAAEEIASKVGKPNV